MGTFEQFFDERVGVRHVPGEVVLTFEGGRAVDAGELPLVGVTRAQVLLEQLVLKEGLVFAEVAGESLLVLAPAVLSQHVVAVSALREHLVAQLADDGGPPVRPRVLVQI